MSNSTERFKREVEQLTELKRLVRSVQATNPFYRQKLAATPACEAATTLTEALAALPFTRKSELVADQQAHPPYGTNLTFPLERYVRCHQTSGSSGHPLRWLDTPESWEAMLSQWQEVFHAAGVTSRDRIFFAFSFGPFLGFWTAFEAATRLGLLSFPGGGLTSIARIRSLLDHGVTTLCCTPTYALHLGETARSNQINLQHSAVRRIIVAGEPGGSIPSTRERIHTLWPGAQVFDHHGMTEVGPVTYECPRQPGVLHIIETSYVAEFLEPNGDQPVPAGRMSELVLTTLKRNGSPLIRYRTGDLVVKEKRVNESDVCACGTLNAGLRGGILGRTDDMVVVRGVNLYPSAVEEVIRRFGEIDEYDVLIERTAGLASVHLRIEPKSAEPGQGHLAVRLGQELQNAFSLRFEIQVIPPGTLPRQELKARRWHIT